MVEDVTFPVYHDTLKDSSTNSLLYSNAPNSFSLCIDTKDKNILTNQYCMINNPQSIKDYPMPIYEFPEHDDKYYSRKRQTWVDITEKKILKESQIFPLQGLKFDDRKGSSQYFKSVPTKYMLYTFGIQDREKNTILKICKDLSVLKIDLSVFDARFVYDMVYDREQEFIYLSVAPTNSYDTYKLLVFHKIISEYTLVFEESFYIGYVSKNKICIFNENREKRVCIYTLAYDGNSNCVVYVNYSADGITDWNQNKLTIQPYPEANENILQRDFINTVFWSKQIQKYFMFYIYSNSKMYYYTSSDSINWTYIEFPKENFGSGSIKMNQIMYEEQFAIPCEISYPEQHFFIVSSDGVNWQRKNVSIPVSYIIKYPNFIGFLHYSRGSSLVQLSTIKNLSFSSPVKRWIRVNHYMKDNINLSYPYYYDLPVGFYSEYHKRIFVYENTGEKIFRYSSVIDDFAMQKIGGY